MGLLSVVVAATMLAMAEARAAPEVDLVAWTVPDPLKAGVPGHLQVSVAARDAIAEAVLIIRPAEAMAILSRPYHVLRNLEPERPAAADPLPAPSAGAVRPEPPALGLVPVRFFALRFDRPGIHDVSVELYHETGIATRSIAVKVVP